MVRQALGRSAALGGGAATVKYPSPQDMAATHQDAPLAFPRPLRPPSSSFAKVCAKSVQVFGRRNADTIHALLRPASKKRQGTKSRDVWRGSAAGAMEI